MSEDEHRSAAVPRTPSTIQVTLASAVVALVGVLLIAPALDGSDATVTVGLVLAEAIALYVGYGALTRVATPTVRELLATS